MKHLCVSYEIAKQLEEVGFDEVCFGQYDLDGELYLSIPEDRKYSYSNQIAGPLYQQVIDWFLEKNILIEVHAIYNFHTWIFGIYEENTSNSTFLFLIEGSAGIKFKTYYEAIEAAIKEAIKIIKSNK